MSAFPDSKSPRGFCVGRRGASPSGYGTVGTGPTMVGRRMPEPGQHWSPGHCLLPGGRKDSSSLKGLWESCSGEKLPFREK